MAKATDVSWREPPVILVRGFGHEAEAAAVSPLTHCAEGGEDVVRLQS